jgi:hypothetical protein
VRKRKREKEKKGEREKEERRERGEDRRRQREDVGMPAGASHRKGSGATQKAAIQ